MHGHFTTKTRLAAASLKRIDKPGLHHDNGPGSARGLYLQVTRTKADQIGRSWIYRYVSPVTGKARCMGLGPVDAIGLADARDLATAARRQVKLGQDPIEDRKKQRVAAKIEAARAISFQACAEKYIAVHEAAWRNAKHKYQWRATLDYACKTMGGLPVAAIDTGLVLKVLEPIWTSKSETASRLRQRIEAVLDWASARGYRTGENPARWRGHLNKLLPDISKVKRVEHYAALPYADIPAFMDSLRKHKGRAALALEFTIHTAARTGEAIGAKWDEIDFAGKVWTVPADRMKSGREHRVPLSGRVLAILERVPRERDNEFIFPGGRKGAPLSNMAMLQVLRTFGPV